MSDLSRILSQIDHADPAAAEQLLPLVYDELRKLAAANLAHEKPGQTIQATALVHEAYLKLMGSADAPPPTFASQRHFVVAAAQAMRRILIDRARARHSQKRGGAAGRIDIDQADATAADRSQELVQLDQALIRLAAANPQVAQLVELRYFGGCTMAEAAETIGVSLRSAHRLWAYAKAWLLEDLATDASE
jgi:RNA polymerase sigma factor (TIGR02999 family)